MKYRARTDEQKQARYQLLIDTAWQLFQARSYEAITMAEVAETSGLAKGTVYLYFKTKEELFLAVQEQQLGAWFDEVDAQLRAQLRIQANGDVTVQVADLLCHTLSERPMMVQLLTLLHVVLEQNISEETALHFKRWLMERLMETGTLLENCLPFLAPHDGFRFLMWAYSLVLGLYQLSNPAPAVKALIMRVPDELTGFQLDFCDECRAALVALLFGLFTVRKKG